MSAKPAPSSLPVALSPAQLDLLARVNRAQVHGLPHLAAALLSLYQRTYGPIPRPLSTIKNLMARFDWSVRHHGPNLGGLALDALREPLDTMESGLRADAGEAKTIAESSQRMADRFKAMAADGVIDARERRELARLYPRFSKQVRDHHLHARELLA